MKVLLVNGSPHKEGCTYTALSEVAETLQKEGIETEFFWIGNKPIGGCIGCGACRKQGLDHCVFGGDAVTEFQAKVTTTASSSAPRSTSAARRGAWPPSWTGSFTAAGSPST